MQRSSSCRTALVLIILLMVLVLPSCKPTTENGDTIVNISDPVGESRSFAIEGWKSFEAKKYADAIVHFRQAMQRDDQFADAYNGLGWSYLRVDSLALSLHYFDIALTQQVNFLDAYAGRSFVSLAMGDYAAVIVSVSAIESTGSKFYSFRHDVNISMNDLFLVKAQSYFMQSNYPSAQLIIDVLDPGNALDPDSDSYIEDLALAIETLSATL